MQCCVVEMEDKAVRFGILGCASIARKLIRAMLKSRNAVPFAVGSRSMETAIRYAARVGLSGRVLTFGSYEEVLQHDEVEAVYVPLPTGLHREWVVKAAEHKKHILLEKPLALEFNDLLVMLEACETAGVQIMDGTMWLHNPRAAEVRRVLQDQTLFGDLLRINASFFFKASEEFLESNIRVKKGLDELGCLGDIGWYCIGAALWAANYELPYKAVALPDPKLNPDGVPLRCGGTLCWRDGRIAVFDCGFDAPLRQRLELAGSNGSVIVDDFVIPHEETSSAMRVETGGRFLDGLGTEVAVMNVRVDLSVPQEVSMVERLADVVTAARTAGRGAVDKTWPERMRVTQRVLSAMNDSLKARGAPVLLE